VHEDPRGARRLGADLTLGRVGRAHGLDGSFYLVDAHAQLVRLGAGVAVDGSSTTITRVAGTTARPIVRLEGVDDRNAARALNGKQLTVARAQAPPLADGEWWADELEGCEVVDGERPIGTVVRLVALPSCEALEVRREDGREPLLVPLVSDAIRAVAIADRRIDVSMEFLGLEAPDGGEPGTPAQDGGRSA
jgi:16S rRNA processing protein RimM